jgi:hypothetical protein
MDGTYYLALTRASCASSSVMRALVGGEGDWIVDWKGVC